MQERSTSRSGSRRTSTRDDGIASPCAVVDKLNRRGYAETARRSPRPFLTLCSWRTDRLVGVDVCPCGRSSVPCLGTGPAHRRPRPELGAAVRGGLPNGLPVDLPAGSSATPAGVTQTRWHVLGNGALCLFQTQQDWEPASTVVELCVKRPAGASSTRCWAVTSEQRGTAGPAGRAGAVRAQPARWALAGRAAAVTRRSSSWAWAVSAARPQPRSPATASDGLHLLDPDRLLWHNVVRHVLGQRHVGRYKTDAMADHLRDRYNGLRR